MVYAVRVTCHIYLDIHLDIYLDVHLHLYLILPHLTSPLTASRPPLHILAPQSVNAIKVHSLVLPSSSTVNLRS